MESQRISNGKVVRWLPTGAIGVVKRAGLRSSKVAFQTTYGVKTRLVSNKKLSRKAAR